MENYFMEAIKALEIERDIKKEVLIAAIEDALVLAYKKNYGTNQNVSVNINRETGNIDVYVKREVVEEVLDEMCEISLEEAKKINEVYEIGSTVEYKVTPQDFGRIAAQTAKQVVLQRLRDAEKEKVYSDYSERSGELVSGIVSRINNDAVFVDIDSVEGIIAPAEKIPGESFKVGDRVKCFLVDVKKGGKGPQLYLSRSHPCMVRKLFELEVPEIGDETVKIVMVARDAGSRTKISVYSSDENVDAVGSCVGVRGNRVKNITDELFGEKIDIIEYSEDPGEYIRNALSPAMVESVMLDLSQKEATVVVPDEQLSLAIGKAGQNARLAAKITGWKIDIKSESNYEGSDAYMDEEGDDFFEIAEG